MARSRVSDTRPPESNVGTYALLGAVLLMGGVLRFWRINDMFHFMGDEGTQTQAEWRLIHGHLPLLGPGLSIGAMHLGPFFYYLEAGPLALAGGSPVGPTIMVGVLGLASVALLFFYLRRPVGDLPAVGASAVMAASFLMVEYSRRPWNPTPTPFFTLIFLWSLVLWKRRSERWLVAVSGSLAILLQLQPVNVFLVALGVVFILLARPYRPSGQVVVLSVILFALVSAPLLLYDASHHLANSRAWLDALVRGRSSGAPRQASSPRLLFGLFNRAFGLRILPLDIAAATVVVIGGIADTVRDRVDDDLSWELLLALILLAIAAVGFEVYRKEVFEQYLICLFVVPFILLGGLLKIVSINRWTSAAGALFVLAVVAAGVRDSWQYSFVTPQVTVADAAAISHDLQRDDTYGHVEGVVRIMLQRSAGRPFDLAMASYLNTDAAYAYALERRGARLERARTLFLLVEPSSWPMTDWPAWTIADLRSGGVHSQTVGLVKLYEIACHRRC